MIDTAFFIAVGAIWTRSCDRLSATWRSLTLTKEQKRLQVLAGIRSKQ